MPGHEHFLQKQHAECNAFEYNARAQHQSRPSNRASAEEEEALHQRFRAEPCSIRGQTDGRTDRTSREGAFNAQTGGV